MMVACFWLVLFAWVLWDVCVCVCEWKLACIILLFCKCVLNDMMVRIIMAHIHTQIQEEEETEGKELESISS